MRSPGRLKLAKRRADNRPQPSQPKGKLAGYYRMLDGSHAFTWADLAENPELLAAYREAAVLADREGKYATWN